MIGLEFAALMLAWVMAAAIGLGAFVFAAAGIRILTARLS